MQPTSKPIFDMLGLQPRNSAQSERTLKYGNFALSADAIAKLSANGSSFTVKLNPSKEQFFALASFFYSVVGKITLHQQPQPETWASDVEFTVVAKKQNQQSQAYRNKHILLWKMQKLILSSLCSYLGLSYSEDIAACVSAIFIGHELSLNFFLTQRLDSLLVFAALRKAWLGSLIKAAQELGANKQALEQSVKLLDSTILLSAFKADAYLALAISAGMKKLCYQPKFSELISAKRIVPAQADEDFSNLFADQPNAAMESEARQEPKTTHSDLLQVLNLFKDQPDEEPAEEAPCQLSVANEQEADDAEVCDKPAFKPSAISVTQTASAEATSEFDFLEEHMKSNPVFKRIAELLKLDLQELQRDPIFLLPSLVMVKKLSDKERILLESAYLSSHMALPSQENLDIVKSFVEKQAARFDFEADNQLIQHEAILDVVFEGLMKKPWFERIVEFCSLELLKANAEKKICVDNKTLILSGKTGVGKSSFIELLIKPVFGCVNIEPENAFQSIALCRDSVQILLSPDDAKISQLYRLSLIPNGDQQLQIKFRETPLNLKCKSMLILTNHEPAKISESIGEEHRDRFARRVQFANIEGDKAMLEYFYDLISGIEISPDFRAFHFWKRILQDRQARIERGQKSLIESALQKRELSEFLLTAEQKATYARAFERHGKRPKGT